MQWEAQLYQACSLWSQVCESSCSDWSSSHASRAYLGATMNCAGGHDKVKIKCKIGVPDSVRFRPLLALHSFPLSCSSNCQNSSQY